MDIHDAGLLDRRAPVERLSGATIFDHDGKHLLREVFPWQMRLMDEVFGFDPDRTLSYHANNVVCYLCQLAGADIVSDGVLVTPEQAKLAQSAFRYLMPRMGNLDTNWYKELVSFLQFQAQNYLLSKLIMDHADLIQEAAYARWLDDANRDAYYYNLRRLWQNHIANLVSDYPKAVQIVKGLSEDYFEGNDGDYTWRDQVGDHLAMFDQDEAAHRVFWDPLRLIIQFG